MNAFRLIAIIAGVALAGPASAERTLTLEEAIALALEKNEGIFIARESAAAAQASASGARGVYNPLFDLERFGIHFVASPRHADVLLVSGPVTRNMEVPLRKTYEATPAPKLVVLLDKAL